MYALWLLLFSFKLLAHQSSLTPSGKELFWANPSIPVAIYSTTSDMSPSQSSAIIQSSLAEWNNAGSGVRLTSMSTSNNEVKFDSDFSYGSAVIGLTEISFNTSGAIQRATILLNDRDYLFRSTPGIYGVGQVFLGDVVTHEFGHLLGISHSEVLNSSMFYSSFSGQNTLSSDDKSGVRNKYDSTFGTISGHVRGGNSVGVLGAHVQAISRTSGQAIGGISDENGYFEIGGLDLNDTYYLYVSPLKNLDSLPGYFANAQTEFCPSSYVGSFFSACGRENDGKPQGVTLTQSHPNISVGTVTINCSLKTDVEYDFQKLQSKFDPLTIYDFSHDQKFEKAFVGWFRPSSTSSWSNPDILNLDLRTFSSLSGTPKFLKVSVISFPLGSQLEFLMTLKKNGATAASGSMSYSPTTRTYNPDFSSMVPLGSSMSENMFEIRLSSRKLSNTLSAQTFPSFEKFSSETYLPYLILASLWEDTPEGLKPLLDTAPYLSDNESCLDAPFTYAVSKALPQDNDLAQSQLTPTPGCGTIEPPNSGPGSSLPLLVTGFFLALLASTLIKSRKIFLS